MLYFTTETLWADTPSPSSRPTEPVRPLEQKSPLWTSCWQLMKTDMSSVMQAGWQISLSGIQVYSISAAAAADDDNDDNDDNDANT